MKGMYMLSCFSIVTGVIVAFMVIEEQPKFSHSSQQLAPVPFKFPVWLQRCALSHHCDGPGYESALAFPYLAGVSSPRPAGCMQPRTAANASQYKIVNLFKTFWDFFLWLHVAMYFMCGPRQLFFFQCGPEMPKGWTPLVDGGQRGDGQGLLIFYPCWARTCQRAWAPGPLTATIRWIILVKTGFEGPFCHICYL